MTPSGAGLVGPPEHPQGWSMALRPRQNHLNAPNTLKAMVYAWPFVRLPLGGLMQKPHLGTLQAVLDGLDILLAQKNHSK